MARRRSSGTTTRSRTPDAWACGRRQTASRHSMTSPLAPNRRWAAARRVLGVAVVGAACLSACRGAVPSPREVTAYVSADRPFSEPIIEDYQRQAGVRVNVVYDTEETKSTGL